MKTIHAPVFPIMTGIVLKVIVALFIWWVLPSLVIKKKKSPMKKWLTVVCAIIGILLLVYAGIDLIQMLFREGS
ncbi:MAG: hypothetical protein IKM74_03830 [Bacteroidales bacterium]|nr:hypothetical protein [Bacteroidales bacterium]